MKKSTKHLNYQFNSIINLLIVITFLIPSFNYGFTNLEDKVLESNKDKEIIWHIKAIHPEGSFIDIKAIDKEGKIYDVKAIQDSDQRSLLDVKAFIGNKRVSVKLLVSDDKYAPLKAIDKNGTIYDIKAITSQGDKLDVKGVKRSGNIIHIKAINKNGVFYGVKAISPDGKLNDVKGIKVINNEVEYVFGEKKIYAHVKAIPPMGCASDNFIWHIKAIHPKGFLLDIKAIDKKGKTYDVKAIRETEQSSIINIKAFVNDTQLPIKLLVSKNKYAPVKAIGENGEIYDIKAFLPNGKKLDVKGVSRTGNIINIKAINSSGKFYGIKAISPEGQLNDVKGIKMFKKKVELELNGVEVYAHVKAISQAD